MLISRKICFPDVETACSFLNSYEKCFSWLNNDIKMKTCLCESYVICQMIKVSPVIKLIKHLHLYIKICR